MMQKMLIDFEDLSGTLTEIIIISDCDEIVNKNSSYFNISDRKYTKTGSETEFKFMKFLLPLYKFTPY
jgi:hypothetical protein